MSIMVTGLAELDANLVKLGQVAGAKAMRGALFVASRPILDQAKANIAAWPKGSGALSLAMGRRYKTSGLDVSGSRFAVTIGPKAKARTAIALYNLSYKRKRPVKGIFYGHLLEFGHKDRAGHAVAAKPFLLPALQAKQQEAVQLLADKLKQNIERALAK